MLDPRHHYYFCLSEQGLFLCLGLFCFIFNMSYTFNKFNVSSFFLFVVMGKPNQVILAKHLFGRR